ncbi:MAG: CPBP family intramembrane metalloprotease [Gammaproteobacteria bacterium]|nr:CPBP family intramembrane metalloprotease [Gammaproteobacteria bacterium]
MQTAIIFILVFCSALFFGAIAAYPVYLLISPFSDMEFHRVISRTSLISGLLFSLLYLRYYGLLSKKGLAWQTTRLSKTQTLILYMLAGSAIVMVMDIALLQLNIYQFDAKADTSVSKLITVVFKALLSGLIVGLVEETIFRGALFGGLKKQSNWIVAMLVTSLLYAAVHFLKYRAVPEDVTIGWLTGIQIFPAALFRFSNPVTIDSFITLFILGMLFAFIRNRSKSIISCIGLHAGIVLTLKIFNYLTNYQTGSQYDYLVNKIDHQFGFLASGVLLISILVYHLLSSSFTTVQSISNKNV